MNYRNQLLIFILFQPGISTETLMLLRDSLEGSPERNKCVTLMFDAMHIMPHLEYIYTSDEVIGLMRISDDQQRDEMAQYLLVLMIRSIFGGWCQIVGHHFTGQSFSKDCIQELLMGYLSALHTADIKCKAVVCDQEPSHMSLFKKLGVTQQTPYFRDPYSDNRVYVILDPPHLMKSTRNNLLQYDFVVSIV